MLVPAMLRKMAAIEKLPVDIEDHVLPEIRAHDIVDEIYIFADPEIESGTLRGKLEHWEYSYPVDEDDLSKGLKTIRVADVYHAKGETLENQRLVCCKELLSILDPVWARTAEDHDIENLIEKIILPAELQDPVGDGHHANADRLAMTFAMAVLFPFAARAILLPAYQRKDAKRLTVGKIADIAELPERVVRMVMSPAWPEIHAHLVGLDRP